MGFFYHKGHLHIGRLNQSLSLLEMARRHDQPIYVYDFDHVLERVALWRRSFPGFAIHYAMKANSNMILLRKLKQLGVQVDVVSAGEIKRALACGFQPEDVIFSGVGKTRAEIELAIELQIKQINVESPQELERIGQLAAHVQHNISVALRVNPDVRAETHPHITTGFRDNKFGIDTTLLGECVHILRKYSGQLHLRGLTVHIGSQLLQSDAVMEAIKKTIPVYKDLQAQGFALDRFDIGGGLGIDYASVDESGEKILAQRFGEQVSTELKPLGCEMLTEPGRFLVGRAGVLIAQVQYIKETQHKIFCILNTGMNHLMRPILYNAEHRILPLVEATATGEARPVKIYDVVGPICESTDVLAKNRQLPELKADEYVAIMDVGAYGFSMANQYNLHQLPEEIIYANGQIVT